jgi:hypothetical protein
LRLSRLEEQVEQLAKRRPREPKRGKRDITDEDRPTDKHRDFAKLLGVDVGPEWGKFKNYCLAHGKQYANFEAAFRNWLANSQQMNGGKR